MTKHNAAQGIEAGEPGMASYGIFTKGKASSVFVEVEKMKQYFSKVQSRDAKETLNVCFKINFKCVL